MNTLFPEDSAERKEYPVYSGALQYFPSALAAVANHSFKGNEKHNPGQPLHHDRAKSGDEADALVRHLMEGDYVGMAWRALALLQKHLEANGAPIAPGARNAKVEMVINTPSGFHLEGSGRDFTIVQDPPDLPLGWLARGGIPAESSYLASFGPNADVSKKSPKADTRVASVDEVAGLREHLTAETLRGYGIGDVPPRHPMYAEALRDHDERLFGGEDRL